MTTAIREAITISLYLNFVVVLVGNIGHSIHIPSD